jgi:hypothetical protein
VIALPEGWRRVTAVGVELYTAPDHSAYVRYRMRVAPLRRVSTIVAAVVAELPEWATSRIGSRERIATHEGELAFGVLLDGRWLGAPARRYIGAIYGDDFYDVVDAIVLDDVGGSALEAVTRTLVRGATLGLGVRPRRYFYRRPAGWHGHATGLVTHWFPPKFPARPTTIVVYPATPTNEQPNAVLEAMVAHHHATGGTVLAFGEPVQIAAASGLAGSHWTMTFEWSTGRTVVRDLAVFSRGAYTYALQLDSVSGSDATARRVFLELASSVEPIAALGATDPGSYAAFSHYT